MQTRYQSDAGNTGHKYPLYCRCVEPTAISSSYTCSLVFHVWNPTLPSREVIAPPQWL